MYWQVDEIAKERLKASAEAEACSSKATSIKRLLKIETRSEGMGYADYA